MRVVKTLATELSWADPPPMTFSENVARLQPSGNVLLIGVSGEQETGGETSFGDLACPLHDQDCAMFAEDVGLMAQPRTV